MTLFAKLFGGTAIVAGTFEHDITVRLVIGHEGLLSVLGLNHGGVVIAGGGPSLSSGPG